MSTIHFCDICGDDLKGEHIHYLEIKHWAEDLKYLPSIPNMELCPPCKEWLKECINIKRYKEEVRVQTETI